jgi:predicted metalloprotease
MRTDNQRRSDNFEDRGRGSGGGAAVGGAGALLFLLSRLGFRGIIIVGLIALAVFTFIPGMRGPLLGLLGIQGGGTVETSGSTCETQGAACDFSRAVLASTEDVWAQQFQQGRLPNYGAQAGAYQNPTLVVFTDAVQTGCGVANSQVGPFYCPADRNLYIDPTFYEQMSGQLRAPGDFAQAYVIAHEVGHHVQNLIGATQRQVSGETQNQTSVRVELQADCFAGVWGHTARANLAIDEADLREALNAAHAIGDDTLGAGEAQYTHGTSAQRMAWFQRGFNSGDARQCDTFAVRDYRQL